MTGFNDDTQGSFFHTSLGSLISSYCPRQVDQWATILNKVVEKQRDIYLRPQHRDTLYRDLGYLVSVVLNVLFETKVDITSRSLDQNSSEMVALYKLLYAIIAETQDVQSKSQ